MVNNNGIPFEVKKPFETVYEIKNETPSYEEFMENYQEGNLNYDDLNGGSVGESKGYGPCSPSYCSCRCPRSDCKCNSGERYVKLYMPCPAVRKDSYGSVISRCPNGGWENRTHWVHSEHLPSNYYTWISNQARIRCEKSYCDGIDEMKHWKFKCSNHSYHKGEYLWTSNETWIDSVALAARVWGDEDLVGELLYYLRTHKW